MLIAVATLSSARAVLALGVAAGLQGTIFAKADPILVALYGKPSAMSEHVHAQIKHTDGVTHIFHKDLPVLSGKYIHTTPHRVGPFGGLEIPVIAGPCSVDDPQRLQRIARNVAQAGASMLRGGAYKGRTSPYAFQGLGAAAIHMLADAKAKTGLPVVTEIIDSQDLAESLPYIDVIQIGARNMHNTALLKAVGQTDKIVLLKHSFGAKLDELLFAADYILAEGNPNVVLCERGIRTFENSVRFSFDMSTFALLKEKTRLPVVVDPSHAAGDAKLVATIAKAAIAAGADGLIVEVHDRPQDALSDGDQALSLAAFSEMMQQITPIAAAVGRCIAPAPAFPASVSASISSSISPSVAVNGRELH